MASDPVTKRITDDVLDTANLIDQLCDEFEAECLVGAKPDIRDYLGRCNSNQREQLFSELVLLEVEYRRLRNEEPAHSQYLRDYPGYASLLKTLDFDRGFPSRSATMPKSTPHDSDERPGQLAHFALSEKLGSGGEGSVWRAWDTRLQRTVAVKLPRFQLDEEELHRFLREGQAAARLKHVCIVPVHEVGRDGDTVFIVSDFVEGQDLRQHLASSRLTVSEAVKLCADVAEALQHAHDRGVVHRDLKPANVMLDAQGRPHITDFGMAKRIEDEHEASMDGRLVGTPAYMSPEQARGEVGAVDHRTDVYAIGVLLYETLTGERPFTGDQTAILNAIIHEEPLRPRAREPKIPRDLETICLKAMDKEPSRRYQSAQEVAMDLRRYQQGEPILARHTGLLERSWRWAKRRPAMAASIGLSLVAVAALAAAATYAQRSHELLGLRSVTLATHPSGAQIAFVPLTEMGGEPLADQIIRPSELSPVEVELKPGDYLVVAAINEEVFHEVYRHVPKESENLPGPYKHNRWTLDDDGKIRLPAIQIPPGSVTSQMALIDVLEADNIDSQKKLPVEFGDSRMTPFYVDTIEFSVADYQKASNGDLPKDVRWIPRSSTWAVTVSQVEAMRLAEKIGKRLPTAAEFAWAAKNRRAVDNLEKSQKGQQILEFGPAGTPQWDQLMTEPPVYGFFSNVAEWTFSSPRTSIQARFNSNAASADYRVVEGGDGQVVAGDPTFAHEHRNPSRPVSVDRYAVRPGLGFRCVRSARPRLSSTDF